MGKSKKTLEMDNNDIDPKILFNKKPSKSPAEWTKGEFDEFYAASKKVSDSNISKAFSDKKVSDSNISKAFSDDKNVEDMLSTATPNHSFIRRISGRKSKSSETILFKADEKNHKTTIYVHNTEGTQKFTVGDLPKAVSRHDMLEKLGATMAPALPERKSTKRVRPEKVIEQPTVTDDDQISRGSLKSTKSEAYIEIMQQEPLYDEVEMMKEENPYLEPTPIQKSTQTIDGVTKGASIVDDDTYMNPTADNTRASLSNATYKTIEGVTENESQVGYTDNEYEIVQKRDSEISQQKLYEDPQMVGLENPAYQRIKGLDRSSSNVDAPDSYGHAGKSPESEYLDIQPNQNEPTYEEIHEPIYASIDEVQKEAEKSKTFEGQNQNTDLEYEAIKPQRRDSQTSTQSVYEYDDINGGQGAKDRTYGYDQVVQGGNKPKAPSNSFDMADKMRKTMSVRGENSSSAKTPTPINNAAKKEVKGPNIGTSSA